MPGVDPGSAVCRTAALPVELHPHGEKSRAGKLVPIHKSALPLSYGVPLAHRWDSNPYHSVQSGVTKRLRHARGFLLCLRLERAAGIAPASSAWKAEVLLPERRTHGDDKTRPVFRPMFSSDGTRACALGLLRPGQRMAAPLVPAIRIAPVCGVICWLGVWVVGYMDLPLGWRLPAGLMDLMLRLEAGSVNWWLGGEEISLLRFYLTVQPSRQRVCGSYPGAEGGDQFASAGPAVVARRAVANWLFPSAIQATRSHTPQWWVLSDPVQLLGDLVQPCLALACILRHEWCLAVYGHQQVEFLGCPVPAWDGSIPPRARTVALSRFHRLPAQPGCPWRL